MYAKKSKLAGLFSSSSGSVAFEDPRDSEAVGKKFFDLFQYDKCLGCWVDARLDLSKGEEARRRRRAEQDSGGAQ